MRGGRISISVACAVALLRVTATLPAQPLASVREAYQPLERELSELKIAIAQKFGVVLSPRYTASSVIHVGSLHAFSV